MPQPFASGKDSRFRRFQPPIRAGELHHIWGHPRRLMRFTDRRFP